MDLVDGDRPHALRRLAANGDPAAGKRKRRDAERRGDRHVPPIDGGFRTLAESAAARQLVVRQSAEVFAVGADRIAHRTVVCGASDLSRASPMTVSMAEWPEAMTSTLRRHSATARRRRRRECRSG